jgi:hypothetical protein
MRAMFDEIAVDWTSPLEAIDQARVVIPAIDATEAGSEVMPA